MKDFEVKHKKQKHGKNGDQEFFLTEKDKDLNILNNNDEIRLKENINNCGAPGDTGIYEQESVKSNNLQFVGMIPEFEAPSPIHEKRETGGFESEGSQQKLRNSIVSFSQQKNNIMLQSPSKRQESFFKKIRPVGPRMVITSVVLTNFKSYYGRQVIGIFDYCFSAIVGPNGSGKSNVIDALLFVFGSRALKIRQKRLSELIYNSDLGDRPTNCLVDVCFNTIQTNSSNGKYSIVDESLLIISRKAFLNNLSQYLINDKVSTYEEVKKKLYEKGIDLDHKRFLILQGEIESIAQMKPKSEKENEDGLLEYLEDLIGSSQFKPLINDLLIKIDFLNQECLEKENRFIIVKKNKNALEEHKNRALKFLRMHKNLTDLKITKYHYTLHTSQNDLDQVLNVKKTLSEEITFQKKQKKLNHEFIAIKTVKIEQDTKEIEKKKFESEELKSNCDSLKKSILELDNKFVNMKSNCESFISKSEELDHENKENIEKKDIEKKKLDKFNSELNQEKKNLLFEEKILNDARVELNIKTKNYTQQIDVLQNQLNPWVKLLKDNYDSIDLVMSSIEIIKSENESMRNKFDTNQKRLVEIKEKKKNIMNENFKKKVMLKEINDKILKKKKYLNDLEKTIQKKYLDLTLLKQCINDSSSAKKKVKNMNQISFHLKSFAMDHNLKGFYGRLGDLGTIDKKYDIAISTACPGLNSFVVESVEVAQALIEHLRKKKLGFANFICLNKIRKFNWSNFKSSNVSKFVVRIFDLIDPIDNKFLPAFYMKIRDTLVANDLKTAKDTLVSQKRWRIVTLDGCIVDVSGTITGGGNSYAKGLMCLKNCNESLSENIGFESNELLNKNLTEIEVEHNELKKIKLETDIELKKQCDLIPEMNFLLTKLELEIGSLDSEEKEITNFFNKSSIKNSLEFDKNNFDEVLREKNKEYESLIIDQNRIKTHMEEYERQLKSIDLKIMSVGGVELKNQNIKVDKISKNIESLKKKITVAKNLIIKFDCEIHDNKKKMKDFEFSISDLKKKLKQNNLDKNKLSDDLKNKTFQLGELLDFVRDKKKLLTDLKSEIEEKVNKINELDSKEIILENKIEQQNIKINKLQSTIKLNNELLKNLVIYNLNELLYWMNPELIKEFEINFKSKTNVNEFDDLDIINLNLNIEESQKNLDKLDVDLNVLKEYGVVQKEFDIFLNNFNSSLKEKNNAISDCETYKKKRLDEFMKGFNQISLALKDIYRLITLGGNAELELADTLDPFSEGILFSVMPPKKSWKNISNLSGGEKTLSSLALVFALHEYKPTFLYFMDEIDAALDFRNVSIIANYINEKTKDAQFIIISLRNNMFELSKKLIGIYKFNNKTMSVSVKNDFNDL